MTSDAAAPRLDAPVPTSWAGVFAGTFAGMAAALQIGKIAATLPLIRETFDASLAVLAVYAALISLVGAVGGIAFGALAARIGPRRVGMAGLALLATGSALGAASASIGVLLATRGIEALGFALTVTSMPAYVQSRAAAGDRSLALGIWSTWMPLGIALTMVIGFFGLDLLGWRGVFLLCAAIPAVAALILARDTPAARRPVAASARRPALALLRGQVLLSAGIFAGFSAGYLAVTAFVPTVLVDELGMAPTRAALIGFVAAIALVPANVFAGWLIQQGVSRRLVFLVTLAGMLVTAVVFFAPGFGPAARVAAAIGFGAFSGAPPAVIWASIPILAPEPGDAPVISGTFFQSAGIGQVLGPLLGGLAVEAGGGWPAALWAIVPFLALCIAQALGVRRP